MKYKYTIKIHTVIDYSDLEKIMNDYGTKGYRVVKAELNKLGVNFNHEARHGGEGKGDAFWTVYSFTKGDEKVFVRFDGWYQSYNGAEYTEWFFVELKEVVVTQNFKTT